ncbi:MAG: aspartate-semialdehyde dehydrogenase [Bacteroidetes bacterium]|nr:MAG: aspartate-semialdehyde dehydrogenase [Bacteroidota bacterium]MBL1143775.1 aspartate-semialdehyde dehydrogenase [Bacteroidota bacterium]MCB0802625.1 aspartate-semialdehyde dehydrogenase [Flavobacteriales bacterium]NOG56576.1 aspartate-semialdehyde dehydrogenase [Bacteroidota bacterium]
MKTVNVALVGATGLVGSVMLELLAKRKFPINQLIPVASENSVGKKITFNGKEITIVSIEDAIKMSPEIALFSAGGSISLAYAEKFAQKGTTVIDNSSAWRMDPNKKLIVPEINAWELSRENKIIANPNCSTIQMVLALSNLHKAFQINRIVISTYQSITGTGVKAVRQLENEEQGIQGEMAYPHSIYRNCIPQCDVFEANGYTKEEMKLVNETKKILSDDTIRVSATAVRVPVVGGHAESVNVSFEKSFELENVVRLLKETSGVIVLDNPRESIYPMPKNAHQKDEVFVGRIRRDESYANSLNLWIVADNLRKGAATNAIQIAEYLISKNLV